MSVEPSAVEGAAPELIHVRGPGAVGGGWSRTWDLLWLISTTEFKKTYYGTVLGYLWSLARPLVLFGVLLAVFTQIFRIGSQVPNYPVLLLFNIVVFGFFSEATGAAVTSIVGKEGIVRKTQFPRIVIPLAVVLTSFFNLLLNLIVVFVFVLAYGVSPEWTWLLLPVILAVFFLFTTAVSMTVASLYPRYRDVGIIWSVASQALFYATPVLYPIEAVPDKFKDLLLLNPLTSLFEQARSWIIDPGADGAVVAAGGWSGLIIPIAVFVAVVAFALWTFNREAPQIAEEL